MIQITNKDFYKRYKNFSSNIERGGRIMGMNVGYLTAGRGSESDECMTPFYACEPLLKYIPKDWTIWCPCDEEWSAYYNIFKENGMFVKPIKLTPAVKRVHIAE